jgi:6-phospho-beta-glucosidase
VGVRVSILGGGGFRVPLICRELAVSGLAADEIVLYDVAPERLRVITDVLAGDHLPLRPPSSTWRCAEPT